MTTQCELEILRLRSLGKSYKKIYQDLKGQYQLTRSEVRLFLISKGLMRSDLTHGGYRSGSGRGSKFILDGEIYDSYAELCFYLSRDDVIKNTDTFVTSEGHNYTPDFKSISGDVYYEIKSNTSDDFWGWNSKKLKGFDKELVIIHGLDIDRYIKSAENKYGYQYLMTLKWRGSFN